ncbi:MAG: hypothetical protein HYV92_13705 [Candidatus Rokubacteria bacterium]|nr:hypothetical protein [Candidatus Rokubacteria bacterium]
MVTGIGARFRVSRILHAAMVVSLLGVLTLTPRRGLWEEVARAGTPA